MCTYFASPQREEVQWSRLLLPRITTLWSWFRQCLLGFRQEKTAYWRRTFCNNEPNWAQNKRRKAELVCMITDNSINTVNTNMLLPFIVTLSVGAGKKWKDSDSDFILSHSWYWQLCCSHPSKVYLSRDVGMTTKSSHLNLPQNKQTNKQQKMGMRATRIAKHSTEKWLKLHSPTLWVLNKVPVYLSCISAVHVGRRGPGPCTRSMGDDDAGWHIACRERSYRAE